MATLTGVTITREGSQYYVTGQAKNARTQPLLHHDSSSLERPVHEEPQKFDLYTSLRQVDTKEFGCRHVVLLIAGVVLTALAVVAIIFMDPAHHKNYVVASVVSGVVALGTTVCTCCVGRHAIHRCKTGPKRKLTGHLENVRRMSMAPHRHDTVVSVADYKEAIQNYLHLRQADETGEILRRVVDTPDNLINLFDVECDHIALLGVALKTLPPASDAPWSRTAIYNVMHDQYKGGLAETKVLYRKCAFDLYLKHGMNEDVLLLARFFDTPEELHTLCREADQEMFKERTSTLPSYHVVPTNWGAVSIGICNLSSAFDRGDEHFGYHRVNASVECMFDIIHQSLQVGE